MSKYRYQMMSEKTHIQDVVNTKHMVSYHMHGFNFIMFLTTIDGAPYNCLISKRELKCYLNQVKMHEVKVYMFRMRFLKDHFYRDTIFDGKLIKTNDFKSRFMIYDTYYLCGQSVEQIPLMKKKGLVDKALGEMKANLTETNMQVEMVKLFTYEEVPHMVYECDIAQHNINGLVFIPEISGKWYIYVNDSEFENIKNGADAEGAAEEKPSTNDSQQEFIMKKTDIPDVYELYWNTANGLAREGIAFIPNIVTSHHCRKLFKDKDMHKMLCIKSLKFNKWIPICQDISELSTVIF